MIDLLSSLPGAVAQGLIWGIMAVGVYITYKLLDIADLTVDGSICTGAAVLCAVAAGLLAGVVTGLLHIWLGIPPILAGILTQMTLWSVNLKILGKANQGLSVRDNHVLLSQMDVPGALVVLAIAAVEMTLLCAIGLVAGYAWQKLPDYRTGLRLSISVLLGHFVGSMVINSLALRIFYGYAWSVLLARIPNALVLSAVNIVLLRILLENRSLMKLAKK